MNATSRFAPSASSPPSVAAPSARTSPLRDRVAEPDDRLLVDQRALVRAHELRQRVLVAGALALDDDPLGVDVDHRAGVPREHDVAGVDGGPVLEAGADERRLRDHQRHGLPLHVRAHQRPVCVVVLEERDERRRDRDDLRRRDVHVVDLLGPRDHGLAGRGAAQHLLVDELARLGVDRLRRLRDRVLRLLGGVEVDDLVGDLRLLDDAVRRLDEAELGDRGVRGERADEADVRALRRLDRAHPAVVGRVDVAHLDRRALAGQAACAERREPPAVREARQRVRLVEELRQLRGAEELLERRHDRADVDDRLRRDRVDVLGRHPLAHDALHAVEADAERLLDQLARRAEPAVAEVLVLVELAADRLARHDGCLGREVLRVLEHAEPRRQVDEPAHEREDVLGGEDAHVLRHRDAEPLVELVAADLRQVVALGVEEQRAQQVARVVERRRLAGALLLEDLDEGLLLTGGGVLVEGVLDVGPRRLVEERRGSPRSSTCRAGTRWSGPRPAARGAAS